MILQLLVDCLKQYDPEWEIGECIEASEKVFSVNHEYCWDVLQRMADEFNTEWEIDGKVIHLRKVERYKTDPLVLSYGKGNGFNPGIERQNRGSKSQVTMLLVQGGERNIDLSKYGRK